MLPVSVFTLVDWAEDRPLKTNLLDEMGLRSAALRFEAPAASTARMTASRAARQSPQADSRLSLAGLDPARSRGESSPNALPRIAGTVGQKAMFQFTVPPSGIRAATDLGGFDEFDTLDTTGADRPLRRSPLSGPAMPGGGGSGQSTGAESSRGGSPERAIGAAADESSSLGGGGAGAAAADSGVSPAASVDSTAPVGDGPVVVSTASSTPSPNAVDTTPETASVNDAAAPSADLAAGSTSLIQSLPLGVPNGTVLEASPPAPEDVRLFCSADLAATGWRWEQSGGTETYHGGVALEYGDLVIREGDSFLVALQRNIVVPQTLGPSCSTCTWSLVEPARSSSTMPSKSPCWMPGASRSCRPTAPDVTPTST